MTVHRANQSVILGLSLPLTSFESLFQAFLESDASTLRLEAQGAAFRDDGFLEARVPEFICAVCSWGHYAGIAGRILRNNATSAIRDAFVKAGACLAAQPPQFGSALSALNALHSLGTPSFASKHLRFIRPDLCPVFDSILSEALPYAFDADGYEHFAKDCGTIARLLEGAHVPNPARRANGAWFSADVEAALFIHVNSPAA